MDIVRPLSSICKGTGTWSGGIREQTSQIPDDDWCYGGKVTLPPLITRSYGEAPQHVPKTYATRHGALLLFSDSYNRWRELQHRKQQHVQEQQQQQHHLPEERGRRKRNADRQEEAADIVDQLKTLKELRKLVLSFGLDDESVIKGISAILHDDSLVHIRPGFSASRYTSSAVRLWEPTLVEKYLNNDGINASVVEKYFELLLPDVNINGIILKDTLLGAKPKCYRACKLPKIRVRQETNDSGKDKAQPRQSNNDLNKKSVMVLPKIDFMRSSSIGPTIKMEKEKSQERLVDPNQTKFWNNYENLSYDEKADLLLRMLVMRARNSSSEERMEVSDESLCGKDIEKKVIFPEIKEQHNLWKSQTVELLQEERSRKEPPAPLKQQETVVVPCKQIDMSTILPPISKDAKKEKDGKALQRDKEGNASSGEPLECPLVNGSPRFAYKPSKLTSHGISHVEQEEFLKQQQFSKLKEQQVAPTQRQHHLLPQQPIRRRKKRTSDLRVEGTSFNKNDEFEEDDVEFDERRPSSLPSFTPLSHTEDLMNRYMAQHYRHNSPTRCSSAEDRQYVPYSIIDTIPHASTYMNISGFGAGDSTNANLYPLAQKKLRKRGGSGKLPVRPAHSGSKHSPRRVRSSRERRIHSNPSSIDGTDENFQLRIVGDGLLNERLTYDMDNADILVTNEYDDGVSDEYSEDEIEIGDDLEDEEDKPVDVKDTHFTLEGRSLHVSNLAKNSYSESVVLPIGDGESNIAEEVDPPLMTTRESPTILDKTPIPAEGIISDEDEMIVFPSIVVTSAQSFTSESGKKSAIESNTVEDVNVQGIIFDKDVTNDMNDGRNDVESAIDSVDTDVLDHDTDEGLSDNLPSQPSPQNIDDEKISPVVALSAPPSLGLQSVKEEIFDESEQQQQQQQQVPITPVNVEDEYRPLEEGRVGKELNNVADNGNSAKSATDSHETAQSSEVVLIADVKEEGDRGADHHENAERTQVKEEEDEPQGLAVSFKETDLTPSSESYPQDIRNGTGLEVIGEEAEETAQLLSAGIQDSVSMQPGEGPTCQSGETRRLAKENEEVEGDEAKEKLNAAEITENTNVADMMADHLNMIVHKVLSRPGSGINLQADLKQATEEYLKEHLGNVVKVNEVDQKDEKEENEVRELASDRVTTNDEVKEGIESSNPQDIFTEDLSEVSASNINNNTAPGSSGEYSKDTAPADDSLSETLDQDVVADSNTAEVKSTQGEEALHSCATAAVLEDGSKELLSDQNAESVGVATTTEVLKDHKESDLPPEPFRLGNAVEEMPVFLDNTPKKTSTKKVGTKKKVKEEKTGGAEGKTNKKKGKNQKEVTSKQQQEQQEASKERGETDEREEGVAPGNTVDLVNNGVPDEKPMTGPPLSRPSAVKRTTPLRKKKSSPPYQGEGKLALPMEDPKQRKISLVQQQLAREKSASDRRAEVERKRKLLVEKRRLDKEKMMKETEDYILKAQEEDRRNEELQRQMEEELRKEELLREQEMELERQRLEAEENAERSKEEEAERSRKKKLAEEEAQRKKMQLLLAQRQMEVEFKKKQEEMARAIEADMLEKERQLMEQMEEEERKQYEEQKRKEEEHRRQEDELREKMLEKKRLEEEAEREKELEELMRLEAKQLFTTTSKRSNLTLSVQHQMSRAYTYSYFNLFPYVFWEGTPKNSKRGTRKI